MIQALLANLWVIALVGLGVSGLALQRRLASLRALLGEHHPQLCAALDARAASGVAPAVIAVMRWLVAGDWQRVDDPLLQAYAATCLRLLRLCVAWLVGLMAALVLAG
jgi:hypothetical protein